MAQITTCWKQQVRCSLWSPRSNLGGSLDLSFVDPSGSTSLWRCKRHSVISGEDATRRRWTCMVLKHIRKIIWNLFWQNGLNFEWSDGTRSLFTFWEDDESQAFGSCVYIDTSGHWKSANCERLLQGAVCHVPPSKSEWSFMLNLCSCKCVYWQRKYMKGNELVWG